jgi:hypothetical protein
MILFDVSQCGNFDRISNLVANCAAGKCVSKPTLVDMVYAHGGIPILTDWIYVVITFFIIQGTNVKRREKSVIRTLMAFASVDAIASLVRSSTFLFWSSS